MKKFLVVIVIAFAIVVQFSQAEAVDYYMGNDSNGNKVYLMTDTVKKTSVAYSKQWRMHRYRFDLTFKAVNSTQDASYFECTIYVGPEELPHYTDRSGNQQVIDDDTFEVNRHFDKNPDIYHANIIHKAYKYLCDNGYV